MPYTKDEYPDSMKNLSSDVREKAIEILNSLIEEGNMNKGMAIATATKKAKEWAKNKKGNSGSGKNAKALHVRSHDDGWAVEEEEADKARHVFDKKDYAIGKAREIARKNQTRIIIHKKNGDVQEERSYDESE